MVVADFWGPYSVTIAGVATAGLAAFAGRFAWRWATALMPTLVLLELETHGYKVINDGDFTIHVLGVEGVGSPAAWGFEPGRARRVAPGKSTSAGLDPESPPLRVDRLYRVIVRDDHFARWELTYDPQRRDGHTMRDPEVRRLWRADA